MVRGFQWTPCCGLLFYNAGSPVWSKPVFSGYPQDQKNVRVHRCSVYLCSHAPSSLWGVGHSGHWYCFCNTPHIGIWRLESNEYQLWENTAVSRGMRTSDLWLSTVFSKCIFTALKFSFLCLLRVLWQSFLKVTRKRSNINLFDPWATTSDHTVKHLGHSEHNFLHKSHDTSVSETFLVIMIPHSL